MAEANDFHLAGSITKMAGGEPLADDDRWPWLVRFQRQLDRPDGSVITCSGLRRGYRDLFRRVGGVRFVFVDLAEDPTMFTCLINSKAKISVVVGDERRRSGQSTSTGFD